jgi:hypothetical protein
MSRINFDEERVQVSRLPRGCYQELTSHRTNSVLASLHNVLGEAYWKRSRLDSAAVEFHLFEQKDEAMRAKKSAMRR